jgi:spore germination cell wall hydrolase CwlJ-like protein
MHNFYKCRFPTLTLIQGFPPVPLWNRQKIKLLPVPIWAYGRLTSGVRSKFVMLHQPFDSDEAQRQRKARASKKRRVFGWREFLLVAIAFLLLALLPSSAQWAFSLPGQAKAIDTVAAAAESADENFTGSAFYFLDPDADAAPSSLLAKATDASLARAEKLDIAAFDSSTFAQPFILKMGTVDHARALKCLTDAIYYEAANEPDAGQRAVAQVIINRMRHPTYPNTVCGVIYQGSERATGCQFSYSCDGSMARIPAQPAWLRAQRVAMQALAGSVYAPVGMATHYHAIYVYPYWAPSLNFVGTIGAHRFYSWKGSAGRPSAFFRSHAGREPFPGPKPRVWTAGQAPLLDPIELQKQYEREFAAARMKAEAEAVAAARAGFANDSTGAAAYRGIAPSGPAKATVYAAPDYSSTARAQGGEATYGGGNLPGNGNVKSEYQASGSWKKLPSGI